MTTPQCIEALEVLARQFRDDAYVSTRKLINPILFTCWSPELPDSVRSRVEEFLASLVKRDLAVPAELMKLAAAIRESEMAGV